jgi:hypothetical protein
MTQSVTLKHVEQLAVQLEQQDLLQLLAHIAEHLYQNAPFSANGAHEKERKRQAQLQLANELLTEVDDIEDDSLGETDAAETIRQMRNERMAQICRKDV